MKILMFSNTYRPHVGGVARSISLFKEALVGRGHNVRIVAPRFANAPADDPDLLRVQAITDFNGSGFSLPLPTLTKVMQWSDEFKPDVIHTHHPFLLGNTAIRCAGRLGVPIVYTYHTLYEQYTHYIPCDSRFLRRFVVCQAAGFCAHCDAAIVPSGSMAQMLKTRGVRMQVHILPTGVDHSLFAVGDGISVRLREGIPSKGFVIGHVGRLAREKNLDFLALALARYLTRYRDAHVLVVGVGPMEPCIRKIFRDHDVADRLHMLGLLTRRALADAYHAMDVFTFSSRSETQGIVLIEAMAAGLPVVALDGPGVRDVIQDGINGRLIVDEDIEAFVQGLMWMAALSDNGRCAMRRAVALTVVDFSINVSTDTLIRIYRSVISAREAGSEKKRGPRMDPIRAQYRPLTIYLKSAMKALSPVARVVSDLPGAVNTLEVKQNAIC